MTTSKQESVDNNININIRINEEYAGLVPVISEPEYETIKQSIKQDGQHVPVIINQKGEILEKQFIININRNRSHLNPFQRIELECKYETIESELAKKRMLAGKKVDPVSDEAQRVSIELSSSSNSSTDEDTSTKFPRYCHISS
jgi:hypothetical protein